MNPVGLVEATERLYRSLFTAAVGFAVGTALWGMVIAPFNGFNDHAGLSLGLGGILVVVSLLAFARRRSLFVLFRQHPAWLLAVVTLSIAVLWADGGWRSSYYLATYAAIALATVVGGLRWSFLCAACLAAGYVVGLAINGYSWAELKALNDADSIIANTGGYLLAAFFFAAPVRWLGGYVARINQVIGTDDASEPVGTPEPDIGERLTDRLSVREVEVVQLVAGGATNDEIAARLFLSPRTIQSHVKSAMEKTDTRNRTELAVLAVIEGLVPNERVPGKQPAADPSDPSSSPAAG